MSNSRRGRGEVFRGERRRRCLTGRLFHGLLHLEILQPYERWARESDISQERRPRGRPLESRAIYGFLRAWGQLLFHNRELRVTKGSQGDVRAVPGVGLRQGLMGVLGRWAGHEAAVRPRDTPE